MGKRYNLAHIDPKMVQEAWASYAKWDYYYAEQLGKAQGTMDKAVSSARARLVARGIKPGNAVYDQEMERITAASRADVTSLQAGQKSLKTGAIRDLLTSDVISKFSAGNYDMYLRTAGGTISPMNRGSGWTYAGGDSYEFYSPNPDYDYAMLYDEGTGPDPTMLTKTRTMEEMGVVSMEDYYTSVWGGYDPQIDEAAEAGKKSTAKARGKAGSRTYTATSTPKGQPGGGKPGNPFTQTAPEIAAEQAPQAEEKKAWWM